VSIGRNTLSAIEVVKVPNIGDVGAVEIIDVLVKPGDTISLEDPLITLETDKAAMDVPSPIAGVIDSLEVKEGDKVSEGDIILKVKSQAPAVVAKQGTEQPKMAEPKQEVAVAKVENAAPQTAVTAVEKSEDIYLPTSDDFKDVTIIEILVAVGDIIEKDQSIIAVESEKASLELPSSYAGIVEALYVEVGQKGNPGDKVLKIQVQQEADNVTKPISKPESTQQSSIAPASVPLKKEAAPIASNKAFAGGGHAGPATRKFARALGVDLTKVSGSGHKGRVTTYDVEQYVKSQLKAIESGHVLGQHAIDVRGLPELPTVDFSQFGETETKPMSRIKKLTARNMFRNWVNIPHVTQFDEADITELEVFRKENKQAAMDNGIPLTPVSFIVKAVASALKAFPQFNASLAPSGEDIIYKKYYHIGVAVDTPNGLLVPVIKNVDSKGLFEIAKELAELSNKAKKGTLKSADLQGNNFTISSLGNMGGTQFTPIINAPDVAILGVSKLQIKPKFINEAFVPKKMLPLAVSYDHRVIDGVEGAKFMQHICARLQDIRKLLL